MNSSERSYRLPARLLLLGVLGVACLPADSQEPLARRLLPGWGLNTAPVEATIEGEHFLASATQHVGGQEPVTLDEHFEASLGDVALEDVVRLDEHRMSVRIPEGLAPGWYPLTVVDPSGQRVELPRAYYASDRPLASLQAQATWERRQLRVGQPTQLRLQVSNTGSTAALGVTALLHLEDAEAVEFRSSPEPEDLAPGASTTFLWELGATRAGTLRFSLELQGHEELTALELQAPGVTVDTLEIRDGLRIVTAVDTSLAVVNLGQPLQVTLHVTNPGTEDLHEVAPGEPQLEGVQASRLSGPEPARMDIPAGDSRDFVWTYGPSSVGTALFQVDSVANDVFTGDPVSLPGARSSGVLVQRPGSLIARFTQVPSSVSQGEPFDVELEVSNPGDSLVRGVRILAASTSGTGAVTLVSGPDPAVLDLAGGSRAVFHARLSGTHAGTCVLRAGAGGQDATDGTSVTAPPQDVSLAIH